MNSPTNTLNRIWLRSAVAVRVRRNFTTKSDAEISVNACGIQMLPRSIHKQIFNQDFSVETAGGDGIKNIKEHLSSHGLWEKHPVLLPNIHIDLPKLKGKNITEHFRIIAEEQASKYRDLLVNFISSEIPLPPEKWNFSFGWTKYFENGEFHAVEFPDEDVYVFDVEVCVKDGHYPTLATAVSSSHWYSWCSSKLFTTKVVLIANINNLLLTIFISFTLCVGGRLSHERNQSSLFNKSPNKLRNKTPSKPTPKGLERTDSHWSQREL